MVLLLSFRNLPEIPVLRQPHLGAEMPGPSTMPGWGERNLSLWGTSCLWPFVIPWARSTVLELQKL